MNVFPLKSLSVDEAMGLQFKLVDSITKFFSGDEILTRGDLGVVKGLNQPRTTNKVEKVLANFFDEEDVLLVRGSGTNAIRLALHSTVKNCGHLLVHDAPIYPTTKVTIDMLGIKTTKVDFNDLDKVKMILKEESFDGVLIQVTRQKIDDYYDLKELINVVRGIKNTLPIITDDNYSALKTKAIGTQVGGTLACFSTFKLLGPEGIGCIVGKSKYISKLRSENYSGGGQVQGHEAIDVLRGLIYAPVSLAISANVAEQVCKTLRSNEINEVEDAFLVNAQSKVIIVKLKENISKDVIEEACKLGALPNPVGAESKYEFTPLFYRVSGTFREQDPTLEEYMIRINPNRAGAETIIRILKESIKNVNKMR